MLEKKRQAVIFKCILLPRKYKRMFLKELRILSLRVQFLLKQLPNYVYLYILSSLLKYHTKLSLFECLFLSLSFVAYIIWCSNITLPFSLTSIQEMVYNFCKHSVELFKSKYKLYIFIPTSYAYISCQSCCFLPLIWWKYTNEAKILFIKYSVIFYYKYPEIIIRKNA